MYIYIYITEVLNNERSYNIITNAGASIRQNRVNIRPVYEIDSDVSDDESVVAEEVIHESAPFAKKLASQGTYHSAKLCQHVKVPEIQSHGSHACVVITSTAAA